MSRPIELLLERLDTARPSGDGYRADCPIGHRSKGSLSFREVEDGKVLLKCHSSCESLAVLHALALEMADLFEKPLITKPIDPVKAREWRKRSMWKAAFKYLPEELRIVWIGSQDVREGRPLNDADQTRFELACERLRTAMATLR